ncbi:hypothetical protein COCSUDRAFT_61078 [Coccomyxa subellipsoidea C-169]|uniref:Uncharacterized protein n=1 Tax=Coccomyxa subellipsoidea (strain C-169) TaxID=574566 RepID=I0Z613_COCSC|nr:hypothetical protein COCSUDRAFT_61078 [Coccomyxa subellipsoidea C-169]EIE26082.1 hypothetical protein COCSUDRAFT_61078 [Coccomyxa subellipsoidea C-169]|eukprot:XP_005650626.1 hypothetical protein COCSUDRAFT_61078 [Coccomyxa subellipsoidea C-169]
MSRDVAIQASAKLSGDWSAPEYTKSLTKEVLQELLPRFPKLDPLVRMRLLLSVMSLPAEARAGMQQELEALSAAVKVDKEEWVGVIGKAVGSFDGHLDLDAVVRKSSAVRETLKDLRSRADSGKTAGMRPLEIIQSICREGVATASAALAQPAANAEAAASLANAAAVHAAAMSAPSPPPVEHAGPSHRHSSDAASQSLGKRSGGLGDMFRSTRPVHVNRPAAGSAASAGGVERKGMQRTAKAKLIDVNEVIALQQHNQPQAPSASQPSESGDRGAAAAANGGTVHAQDPDDELEEGEVAEEGELPMPAANPTKRHRLNGPPKVAQQPYRDRGPYSPPPRFSPQRYADDHLSPGRSRQYGEHAHQRGMYDSYNGGPYERSGSWQDFDAPQQDPSGGMSNHRKRHSIDQQLGYLTTLAESIAYYVVSGGVNFAAILIATALFPMFYTAGIAIKIADLKGRDNRLAGPGKPDIQYPRFLPLGGKSQIIFNNVLEEVLSWVYGKYDLDGGCNEPTINSLKLLFTEFPCRLIRSCHLLNKWLSYLVFGSLVFGSQEEGVPQYEGYIQGIDFSIDRATLAAFPSTKGATSKENALVLAIASQLSYNRIYLIRDIVNRNWTDVTFKGGWEFDYVSLKPKDDVKYEQKNSDISAVLLQVGGPGEGRALILAFRGTEPLKNVNWAVDFQTEPPPEDEEWKYGVYHMGFRTALGLGPNLASDRTSKVKYLSCNAENGQYKREKANSSPFLVMKAAIDAILAKEPKMKLYVTGHSLGAALASIFAAALVVPPDTKAVYDLDPKPVFGALCTFGQPRVGNAKYTINLESALSKDRTDRRYMRVVNTDDIVCRMPPPQVSPPPWYADAPFWQHPGHLVFLPAVPARFKPMRAAAMQNGSASAPTKTPTETEEDAPENQPGARERNPSVVELLEQPTIYRGSSLWHAIKKALWATLDLIRGGAGINKPSTLTFNPAPSLLRVLTLWLVVVTVLPLGLLLLPTPLFPVGVALILIGLLWGGLTQGVSDHALDGYIRAIVASNKKNWTV